MSAVEKFERGYAAHQARLARQALIGWGLFAAALVSSVWVAEISLGRLFEGVGRLGEFFWMMLPDLEWGRLFADTSTQGSFAYWYYDWRDWAALIGETIEIAILSTVIGVVVAFVLSFPAARNLGVPAPVIWATRRFLEFCRTVPELVFALIFVFAFGIGPLAGVLAISIHTIGALGKLFSEVHENVSNRPIEGVRGAGGTWLAEVRYGVVPQVLPVLTSYTLLRFEINVGASAAVGIVGAGGIGQALQQALVFNELQDTLAMILMIVGLVFIIDFVSERLRSRLMGVEGSA